MSEDRESSRDASNCLLGCCIEGRSMRQSPSLGAALLAVVLGFCSPAPGPAQDATPSPPGSNLVVKVSTEAPRPTVHHDWGFAQIQGVAGKQVAGYTQMVLETMIVLDTTFVSSSSRPSWESSFWVSGISVTLRYNNIDIYLYKNYREDTCLSQALLEHENEHVREDRELVETYAEKMKAALLDVSWPTYSNPLRVASAAEGMEQTEAQLRRLLAPLDEELREKRRQASDALDVSERHQDLLRSCPQK